MIPFLIILLFSAISGVEPSNFTADVHESNPNEIILRWNLEHNDDIVVEKFRIERKMMRDAAFTRLEEVPSATFEYIDRKVFTANAPSGPVTYKLYATYSTGEVLLGQVEVHYPSNALWRTWGNIKSMFQ
ncbi:MAG: hypothetical protein WD266_03455 [Balneolales bacterium]